MSWSDIPEEGRALLVLGGIILTGVVINELTKDEEDEPTREAHPTTGLKDQRQNPKKSLDFKRYIVQVQKPSQTMNSRVGLHQTSLAQERKYNDDYYRLSKSQQYKYRQKMAQELFQISQNK